MPDEPCPPIPFGAQLTPGEMARLALRRAALRARVNGVPEELALAEVRYGYAAGRKVDAREGRG